jgi:uncharacterized protein DUF4351
VVATLFRLETCSPEDLRDLMTELVTLLPRGKEPELREDFTTWLRGLVRRLRPGVTIPEVGDLEEIAMLEETLAEWLNGAERKARSEGLAKGREQGREEGWVEGREEGKAEGRQQGKVEGRQQGKVEGMRQLLLEQLKQRFGPLPPAVRRRVGAIDSPKELGALAKRVLAADSLAEMGFGPAGSGSSSR